MNGRLKLCNPYFTVVRTTAAAIKHWSTLDSSASGEGTITFTIAIRLRYDYDTNTTYRARLVPFDASKK